MINSILTATNQEQLTYIALTVSAEIQEREGSIYRSKFYNQRHNYYSLVLVLSSQKMGTFFVTGAAEQDKNAE